MPSICEKPAITAKIANRRIATAKLMCTKYLRPAIQVRKLRLSGEQQRHPGCGGKHSAKYVE